MSENYVIPWTSDYSLKWSDFKAELNPAVFEDSHSAIKYGFTWTVNSDKIDDKIVFLIDLKYFDHILFLYHILCVFLLKSNLVCLPR